MSAYVLPAPPVASLRIAGRDERFPVHRIYCVGRNFAEHAKEMGAEVSRGTPVLRRQVEPVLTPRFVSAHRFEINATSMLSVSFEGRYQSRAYLDNTSSADRVLPDFYTMDASAKASWSRVAVTVRGVNLGDTQKYGSGSVSSSGRVRYFVLPARAVYATLDVSF